MPDIERTIHIVLADIVSHRAALGFFWQIGIPSVIGQRTLNPLNEVNTKLALSGTAMRSCRKIDEELSGL